MKKRWKAGLLALIMAVSISACGSDEEGSEDRRSSEERNSLRSLIEGDESGEPETEEGSQDEQDPGADEQQEVSVPWGMLGGEVDPEYDGFAYLYCVELTTEPEEEGKSQSLYVFIPEGSISGVSTDGSRAYAEDFGIELGVYLNPYIQYKQEDYLLKENLEYYLQDNYDPFWSTRYKGLEISEVETLENGVRATVKYCLYDSYDDDYVPVLVTYYMTELSNGATVLVSAEVGGFGNGSISGRTDKVIQELETFYGFDIEWSQEAADEKKAAFMDSDEVNVNMVSVGYMMFELPKGWEQDYSWDDYSADAFAPDGDSSFSECAIVFKRQYYGMESIDMGELMEEMMGAGGDMDEYVEVLKELIGEEGAEITIENYGDTVLGPAMKISVRLEENSFVISNDSYVMTDGYYMYTIQVYETSSCTEDVTAVVENILATAQINKY